ncbi:unnamed protein product [Linum tenue]|uniref:Uncharacterized protein n=1 Tax=Linum tenue TaxID=586396 RepID=A0AAV0I108_9ROSI|nr:unnamed protein product [Linum tenue]
MIQRKITPILLTPLNSIIFSFTVVILASPLDASTTQKTTCISILSFDLLPTSSRTSPSNPHRFPFW